ncbi:hypothetical protein GO496_04335 [Acidovorax citrulli]|nr:hypothetical protein [Paracidovorax citrulli]
MLTGEEAEALRLMLTTAVDRLPKHKRAAAMVKGWSKLKAHFHVSYRQIPRSEFTEALSIVARHTAEWDLVDEAPSSGALNEQVARMVRQVEGPKRHAGGSLHAAGQRRAVEVRLAISLCQGRSRKPSRPASTDLVCCFTP